MVMSVGGRTMGTGISREVVLNVFFVEGTSERKLHDTMIVDFCLSCVARNSGKRNENGMKFHYFVLDFHRFRDCFAAL